MVGTAGAIIITILVLAAAAVIGWVAYSRWRAQKLGVSPHSLSPLSLSPIPLPPTPAFGRMDADLALATSIDPPALFHLLLPLLLQVRPLRLILRRDSAARGHTRLVLRPGAQIQNAQQPHRSRCVRGRPLRAGRSTRVRPARPRRGLGRARRQRGGQLRARRVL